MGEHPARLFDNVKEKKMLHTPVYDVRSRAFCGPTAMSAVTGQPISIIRGVLQSFRGPKSNGHNRAIMGVGNDEMLAAMAVLGWRVVDQMRHPKASEFRGWYNPPKLRDFLDYVQMNEGAFIVNVTGHYIAASETEVCDTYTALPIPIAKWKRSLGRHVKNWWKFEN